MSDHKPLENLKRSVTLTAAEWLYVIENLDGWDYLKEKIVCKLLGGKDPAPKRGAR